MNNFYQKLIGLKVRSTRGARREIVACWQFQNGVRCLTTGKDGATFLVDLPDTDWEVELIQDK